MEPEGLVFRPGFISEAEERRLAEAVEELDFQEIRMHGVVARRTSVHFGYLYDYGTFKLTPGPPQPAALDPLRERCAELIGAAPEDLVETLVNRYPPGAAIGWHRDAPAFGAVIGVSLLSACRMRFQRGRGAERRVAALELPPRSAYVLDGPARTQWQHSIPAAKALRYSITFRTLRRRRAAPAG